MITTWISDEELEAYTTVEDHDLHVLLTDARKVTGDRLFIQTDTIQVKQGWFRPPVMKPLYTLYWRMRAGDSEVSIVNFYGERSSIRTSVPKEIAVNYLFGLLTGRMSIFNDDQGEMSQGKENAFAKMDFTLHGSIPIGQRCPRVADIKIGSNACADFCKFSKGIHWRDEEENRTYVRCTWNSSEKE